MGLQRVPQHRSMVRLVRYSAASRRSSSQAYLDGSIPPASEGRAGRLTSGSLPSCRRHLRAPPGPLAVIQIFGFVGEAERGRSAAATCDHTFSAFYPRG